MNDLVLKNLSGIAKIGFKTNKNAVVDSLSDGFLQIQFLRMFLSLTINLNLSRIIIVLMLLSSFFSSLPLLGL